MRTPKIATSLLILLGMVAAVEAEDTHYRLEVTELGHQTVVMDLEQILLPDKIRPFDFQPKLDKF